MISRIYGVFAGWENGGVVVDTKMGVAFFLYSPKRSLEGTRVGDDVTLHVHVHHTQTGVDLYGFATSIEREIFRKLITARGVGPKNALSLLDSLSAEEIVSAVVLGDEKALTAARGIGPKLAKKLIIELRDAFEEMGGLPAPDLSPSQMEVVQEVQDALRTLGYGRDEIASVLPDINDLAGNGLDTPDILAEVLSRM